MSTLTKLDPRMLSGPLPYILAVPGALERTLNDKLNDVVSVTDFTAVRDGTVDVADAIQNGITAALAAHPELTVVFPAGIYLFSKPISIVLPPNRVLRIIGAGEASTELRWNCAAGGLSIIYQGAGWWFRGAALTGNSLTVADLALTTTQLVGAGTALLVKGSCIEGRPALETAIRNISVRSADGTTQWDVAVDFLDVADSRVENVHVAFGNGSLNGIGVNYRASGAGKSPTSHFVSGYRQYFGGAGIKAGDYIEGIHAQNLFVVGADYGVFWPTATGETQLALRGSHIAAVTGCVYLKNVHANQIVGNLLIKNGGTQWTGVLLDACGQTTVTGNTIMGAGANTENGIIVSNSVSGEASWFDDKPSVVSGNVLEHINGAAIWLKAGTSNVHLADNQYAAVATRVQNDGLRVGNTRSTNRGRWEGALVSLRNANQAIAGGGAVTTVMFDTTDDDTGTQDAGQSIVNLAASKLIVPSGCSRVRLFAQVSFAGSTTLRKASALLLKNGSSAFLGNPAVVITTDPSTQQGGGYALNLTSPVLNVNPGDSFQLAVSVLNDGNSLPVLSAADGSPTWFSLEAVE